jgi:hypothetical protein
MPVPVGFLGAKAEVLESQHRHDAKIDEEHAYVALDNHAQLELADKQLRGPVERYAN